jgi:hypothetical protein
MSSSASPLAPLTVTIPNPSPLGHCRVGFGFRNAGHYRNFVKDDPLVLKTERLEEKDGEKILIHENNKPVIFMDGIEQQSFKNPQENPNTIYEQELPSVMKQIFG